MACRLFGAKPLCESILVYPVNWTHGNKLRLRLNQTHVSYKKMDIKVSSAKIGGHYVSASECLLRHLTRWHSSYDIVWAPWMRPRYEVVNPQTHWNENIVILTTFLSLVAVLTSPCAATGENLSKIKKWVPFCRRHFQPHFLEWIGLNIKLNFTEICS